MPIAASCCGWCSSRPAPWRWPSRPAAVVGAAHVLPLGDAHRGQLWLVSPTKPIVLPLSYAERREGMGLGLLTSCPFAMAIAASCCGWGSSRPAPWRWPSRPAAVVGAAHVLPLGDAHRGQLLWLVQLTSCPLAMAIAASCCGWCCSRPAPWRCPSRPAVVGVAHEAHRPASQLCRAPRRDGVGASDVLPLCDGHRGQLLWLGQLTSCPLAMAIAASCCGWCCSRPAPWRCPSRPAVVVGAAHVLPLGDGHRGQLLWLVLLTSCPLAMPIAASCGWCRPRSPSSCL